MNVSLIPKELEAYIASLEAENAQMTEDMDRMASVIEGLENKLKSASAVINCLLRCRGDSHSLFDTLVTND